MPSSLYYLVNQLGHRLKDRHQQLATAESCTGGQLASVFTSVSGASQWFAGGVITYSIESKHRLLGLSSSQLTRNGAVNQETALAMAEGVLAKMGVDIAIAITGIAGPTGATTTQPVGTVYIAWIHPPIFQKVKHCLFPGDRAAVRTAAVRFALTELLKLLHSSTK
jgi:nicotinamide-nucleotide amidase